jgi:myo-inositol 2-dehydrogenase/D-chiro-inositol 1-dehydrogenase
MLGCGRIGRMHAELIANRVPGAALHSVFDVVPAAAADVAARFGVPALASVDDVLESDADAVAICTTTGTHAELIIAAARAGKATFCEKPISLDLATVDEAIAAVDAAGTLLQVGFNRRFDPGHQAVQRAAASGELGAVWTVKITSRDNYPPSIEYLASSGGMFLDMTIHDFDLARFVVGSEVVEVYAAGAALVDPKIGEVGDVDTSVVMMRHESGCFTIIDNSRAAGYGYDQRLEAFGSKGIALSENPVQHATVIRTGTGHKGAPMYESFPDRYSLAFQRQWEAFVNAVVTGGESPASGRDARAPLVIGLAANESLRTGVPVSLVG